MHKASNQSLEWKVFKASNKNHPVMHMSHVIASCGTMVKDGEVPTLCEKATKWDRVSKIIPDFTLAMLMMSNIIYETHPDLLIEMKKVVDQHALEIVNFVPNAIWQSWARQF